MSTSKDVGEQLDEVVVEFMCSMKKLEHLREKYTAAVGEGYFNMAKARYSMGGSTSVSKLQYDCVMSPLVHVAMGPESDQAEPTLTLLRTPIDRSKKTSGASSTAETKLRRRVGKGTSEGGVEDVPKGSTTEGDTYEEGEAIKDPLKWFGVLLPKCLSQAQQDFIEAISHAVELAQAQGRLEFLRKKYCTLLQEKQRLCGAEL